MPDIKLTKLQREILESLRDGEMITIDRSNMAFLGDRPIQPQTRYFLTDKRLVRRKDKTRNVDTKENGFVISPKGIAILEQS